jgi:hypothetical protein
MTSHAFSANYLVLGTIVFFTYIHRLRYSEPQTWAIHASDFPKMGISSLPIVKNP